MARMLFVETPLTAPEPDDEPVRVKVPMSEQLISWIEHRCRVPGGALTEHLKQQIRALFDGPPAPQVVEGELAAYLALASLVGPTMGDHFLQFATDDQTMWDASGPQLQRVLGRDGQGRISCSGGVMLL